MTEKRNILEHMANSLGQMLDHVTKKHPDRRWMYEAQNHYWDQVHRARELGIPVVWHNQGAAPELLYGLGVIPLCLDVLAASLAAFEEMTARYVDVAHKYIPEHLCAINKTGIGLAMSGEIPKPDAFIYVTAPCDSARIAYPLIADALDIPHFCIDTPFQESEAGYEYIANEMREALLFLEEVTGRRLDWSSMTEVIENSNQSYELFGQIADLRKSVPCPLPGRLLSMNAVALGMTGSPQLVEFLRRQRDVGIAKKRKNEGHLPEEKMRVAWLQNPIFFDFGVMDWMEKEYGAVVAMDTFGFRKEVPIQDPSDEAEVFRGLAKRSLGTPMTHVGASPVEYCLESVAELFRDYKCNVAIFAGHVGCTHNWAVAKLIKDMIYDEFGITTLVFDVDALDPRYASSETIKGRIRSFLEVTQ